MTTEERPEKVAKGQVRGKNGGLVSLALAAMIVLLLPLKAHALAENLANCQTTAPADARYEIVQSSIAAEYTFLLDKYRCHVFQLVMTPDSSVTWQVMPVADLPQSESDSRVRYQIFTSGIAARFTFLLNVETSKTWQLTQSNDSEGNEILFWQPLPKH